MKRKRATTDNVENDVSCPLYGTQEYWEDRYKRNYKSEMTEMENKNVDDKGHEWYFSYPDLKPLLLPIILGREDEVDELSDGNHVDFDEDDDDDEDDVKGEQRCGEQDDDVDCDDENSQSNDPNDDDDNNDYDSRETDESWDESLEYLYKKRSAQKSPRKILEIGCGDVPLMDGVLQTLYQLEQKTNINTTSVIEQIVAFDYSHCVIDVLLERQKKQPHSKSKLNIDYMVHDARKMPYSNYEFNVIVDKGTLDAMLSDENEGKENCVQIISESSRLLRFDGYLMIVSHLNANGEAGMNWLSNIVVPGLETGDKKSNYSIEVHGNDNDDHNNLGPAVYIIRKYSKEQGSDSDDEPTIDVKFFAY